MSEMHHRRVGWGRHLAATTRNALGGRGYLGRLAIVVALSTAAAVLVPYLLQPAYRWAAHNWPWSQIVTVGLTVLTVVVLVLLVAVVVTHAVILTGPFPRPYPTRLGKENRRLQDIASAVHSAIEAGRRR